MTTATKPGQEPAEAPRLSGHVLRREVRGPAPRHPQGVPRPHRRALLDGAAHPQRCRPRRAQDHARELLHLRQRRLAKQAAAAAKKKERTRAKSQHAQEHKKAALPVREALLFEPSPQRGRLGVRVRRGARHRRRWRKPRTASNKKHRLPTGRRCFCTHAVVTTRCRTTARAR